MSRITNKEKIERLKNNIIDLENFINSAFHDLKTPLFTLGGFLDAFYEIYYDKINEKGQEYLDIMQSSIKKIESIINDIFSLFKYEKINEKFKKVDIIKVIKLSLDRLQVFFKFNDNINIDIKEITKISKEKKGIFVLGSMNFLMDIFVNIISNSIKYRKDNDALKIRISLLEEKDGYYTFYIKDNGIGISKEYKDFIFNFFTRIKEKKDIEGTGMGLALVKRIIEKHSGRIWFNSKKNYGTTFYFTLPKYKSKSKH